jgi:hypothetical protein
LAGFEVTLYGRFWVTPEEIRGNLIHKAHSASQAVYEIRD